MITAHKEVELAVRMPVHEQGTTNMLSELRHQNVEVRACTCYQDHSRLVALLIADDPARTLEVLQQAGYDCKSQPVILVEVAPYNPGLLVQLRAALERAGVSILSSHLCRSSAKGLSIAVQTTDNTTAFTVLQQAQGSKEESLHGGLESIMTVTVT